MNVRFYLLYDIKITLKSHFWHETYKILSFVSYNQPISLSYDKKLGAKCHLFKYVIWRISDSLAPNDVTWVVQCPDKKALVLVITI